MPTRPFVGDLVAVAPHGPVGDPQTGAVDRDEVVDTPFELVTEQVLDATKVANPLLTHRPDEDDRAFRFELHLLHGPGHGKYHGQPTAVIADPGAAQQITLTGDRHVGTRRENGIEVGREHHSRPITNSWALADGVALGIDADLLETERIQAPAVLLGTLLFMEWRRGDLADRHLVVQGLRLGGPQVLQGTLHRRVISGHLNRLLRAPLRSRHLPCGTQEPNGDCQEHPDHSCECAQYFHLC